MQQEQHTDLPILLLLTAGAVVSHSCQCLVPKRLGGAPACFPGSPFQYSQQTAAQPGSSTEEHRRARHTASPEDTLTRVLSALSRREWIWVRKLKAKCVQSSERGQGPLCQRQTFQPALTDLEFFQLVPGTNDGDFLHTPQNNKLRKLLELSKASFSSISNLLCKYQGSDSGI